MYKKAFFGFLLASIIATMIEVLFGAELNELYLLAFIGVTAILTVCFFVLWITHKFAEHVSPYFVFALTVLIIAIIVIGYGIFNIMTDTGFFAGLLGMLLILFIVPVSVVLLAVDFILYRKSKHKKEQNQI